MNQFKDVFLGTGSREYSRAADTQKCIRVSGKHNDLEEVGVDTYHHTFFEMLGNWSFGDYYKPEAIEWAWELLTKIWKLDPVRLHATVYRTDDEAYDLWKKYLPVDHIHRFDEKDNFWEMGETGPCGPCSEIHYDRTPDLSGAKLVNTGVPEVIEIWNLVFIQYNRKADGSLHDLTAKHVDTGMGFERICSVIQGKMSNYDTDVFIPLLKEIESISGREYSPELTNPDGIAMRVLADHVRTLSFAIADGAIPGNEGRGYVLRRILRRGSRFARNLGIHEPILYKLVPILIETMGNVFPELVAQRNIIEKVIRGEEESFLQTLDRGLDKFEEIISDEEVINNKTIPGKDAFLLYDTFGFPLDLTELLSRERGFKVDHTGFDALMAEQKQRSRSARKVQSQEVELPLIDASTEFTGYDMLECEAKILLVDGNIVITDKTPFYAESGGQISDTGEIVLAGEKYYVLDVKRSGNAVVHICDREVEHLANELALLKVDEDRRRKIMRNHSATHLLHEALRRVFGNHIKQAGSLVAPNYLRFDFNHFEKVKAEEILKIENIVNNEILADVPVVTRQISLEDAQKNDKIRMFFGDKYGSTVRLVTMDSSYSSELCGGTHVGRTGEIGLLKIVSETSIAAGVRRIEAVTGSGVQEYIYNLHNKLDESHRHSEDLLENLKQAEKEITALKMNNLKSEMQQWIADATVVDGIRVVVKQIEADNMDQMRTNGESLRNMLGSNGVGMIATIINDKVQLVCISTDDLKSKLPAGKLVGAAAKIVEGGGGGNPHLATAGGKNISLLPKLLEVFPEIVKEMK
jgi:alanyl-tRNA synthetase